jgi:hypothetical protein
MVKHPKEFEEFTKELVENEVREGYMDAPTGGAAAGGAPKGR